MRIGRDDLSGQLQSGHRLFARYGRELLEEYLKAVSCLEIVEENLHRDPRSDEHRSSPKDLGVPMDDQFRFSHYVAASDNPIITRPSLRCQNRGFDCKKDQAWLGASPLSIPRGGGAMPLPRHHRAWPCHELFHHKKRRKNMKRIGLLFGFLIAFGGLALALQSPDLQQKAAAAKEAAARNQQALRSYSWITKTELSVKGEVKNTKLESCQYGPDGKVQKTELSEPPPPPQQQRGLKGKIVAKKTGEMKEELQASAALVQTYIPPSPDKLQAVIAAGKVTIAPGSATAIRFPDYEKQGDSLTLTLDSAAKALRQISVDT